MKLQHQSIIEEQQHDSLNLLFKLEFAIKCKKVCKVQAGLFGL